MKSTFHPRAVCAVIGLTLLSALTTRVQATPPDLTAAGVIAALKTDPNASPTYGETYNLGATGLRGWIHVGGGNGADGTITTESRQILVTVANAPGSAVLAVDDVILGAVAASSGTVPLFTSDARKAIGTAIGDAEKTGAGSLRVKRWRAGTTTDVNIAMTIMGNYAATAPYSCPKSALVLTNARNKLVSQLLADSNFLTNDWKGAISGLALLAGVQSGDPDYATVQTRLQTYARACAAAGPQQGGLPVWNWAYTGLFLAEYYLSTGDANVLSGINAYTLTLVQSQSIYGTYGHDSAALRPDGSGRRINIGYGPVNQVGIVANMAIFMGKKALLAGGQTIDPGIDTAIQLGSDFFAWYVNKGPIPYGEHAPWMGNHESNGKDPLCAVFFGLQPNRTAATEYFTRMSIAGFNSRESGHTGQGFSYLWGAMGANVGGSLATAEYLKNVRWHLDLSRRTDGSFAYDGREGWGPGTTADGTYLGASGYNDMNATACYILTYSLPLQRLYITGKNADPANTLDSTTVAQAIAAATFKQDSPGLTNTELITALSDFDPLVRHYAAIELGTRSPSSGELTTLRGMVTGPDANGRMGACQALGLLQDAAALSLLNQRLDKNTETNSWVRAKAGSALRSYPSATASVHRDSLLAAFTANATDPDAIDWDDPVQISNSYLSQAVFGNGVPDGSPGNDIAAYTINAPKNLLYPAVTAGLKQPDSYPRTGAAKFCYDRLTLADVQSLVPDFFELVQAEGQADRMWGSDARAYGIDTLAKHKISEGIPLALSMLEVPEGFEWGVQACLIPALNAMESYGDAARWTLPMLNGYLNTWDPQDTSYPQQVYPDLVSTIATIENAIIAPAQNLGLAVANPQVVSTTGAKAITLTGASPRGTVTFTNVTAPAHGTLTGTPPYLTYTPAGGYTGPDHFSFEVADSLTTSGPGTVSIIVGTAGTGLKGEYFDNADFTNLKLTRTDAQVNFDWGTGSPNALVGADTFSVRWSGVLLVPETGSYMFSTLNSDGVRLYVNGVAVIDLFADQSTNWNDSTSIALTEGQLVEIQMDYYENTGDAVAKLKWTGPSLGGASGAIIGSQWLFDGTGMTRTPYAHAQTVPLVQNTSKAIMLTGSGGALTYTVLTQPAHGTLTGTAPNLTYTPTANYSGSDSFTFRVNNGTSDSAPATVSIGISAGPSVGFTWLNASSGNLSVAANWTSGTAPAATGQPTYNLNFTPAGTYTVTHDLNNGFQLNQLNLAGAVTLAGTNSLAFTANGFLLPQFNQNSGSAVTIDTPVNLAAMTTFGGTGGGSVTMTKLISGTGGLTKSGAGTLQIHGVTQNTFSGGTVVTGGTLHLGAIIDGTSPNVVNPVGTGSVTLNGGIIRFDRVTASNALTVNGGTLNSSNGWGATWSGPITLNSAVIVDTTYNMTFSGTVSGGGGIAKTGGSTLVLTGNNSSTGANSITAGTLSCSNSAALGTGILSISGGGKAALNYTGTRTINSLYLGGTPMSAGTYGSTASPATHKNDTCFSGTGTVTAGPPNTAPVANPQSVGTAENTALPITLTATDAEANPLTYVIVSNPAHGILTGTAPNVIYTPSLHYIGTDGFTFKVNDGTIDSAPATVVITVTAGSTGQLTWGAAPAITAASDIQSAGVSNLAGANFGITTGTTTTVSAAETGTVDVEFKSLGSGQNVTLSNGINVAAASDWVNWGFASGNSAVTGNFGTVLDSNLGIETGAPVSSSATITLSGLNIGTQYQIQFFADSTGSNSQTISDSGTMNSLNGQFITGTFTADATSKVLTIIRNTDFAVANALTIGTIGTVDITPPTLAGSSMVDDKSGGPVVTNTLVTYTVTFSEDMDASTVSAADFGNAGTSSLTIGTVTETSPGVFTVPATPTIAGTLRLKVNAGAVLNDAAGNALVTTAAITDDTTITVTQPNTAPVANAQSLSTPEDITLPITLGATDAEANPLTYAIVTNPAHGTLGGTAPNVTYTPAANYYGPDSFTFKANDGSLDSAPATVDITVTPVNDPPVANAQSNVTTAEDTAKAITLTGTDVEGGTLTYTLVTNPAHGTLSGTAPNVTYTPAANYYGADSFTFKVNDGSADSVPATISITVTPVNDAPVATPQSVSTAHNTAKAITLAGTDVEGSALTYTVVTQPTRGALSGTAPNVTYTPTSGTSGPDSFTFKVNDGTVDSTVATVAITVALPLPWIDANIGTGMLAGSVTTSAGTFTQAGSGVIGSTSDKFNFLYQTLTGDGEIKVKISALQNTGTSSRVGVMIRDTLAANSKQIFMGMTGSNAYRWVRRTTTGGNTTSSNSSTGTVPNTWVRLVRSGTTITAYKSTNGTSWTSVGSTTNTTFASTCYIGLAVGSGSNTTLNTSQFNNVSVTP